MSRKPALDGDYCLRRVAGWSPHWLGHPENRATSAAFWEKNGEVSVNLESTEPTAFAVCEKYKQYIDQGMGYCIAKVESVRTSLSEREILGDVLHDPLPNEVNHGIITGKPTKAKDRCLANTFTILIKPKEFRKIYGN